MFCIIQDAHADLDAARAACDGRFTECGRTLDLGLPPRWREDPLPQDVEWRIAWHKLYVGLDLAHAYEQTGELRFLTTWRVLVTSFIAQIGPTDEHDCHLVARRVLNTLYAWDRFTRAMGEPALGRDDAEALWRHLGVLLGFIRDHLTPTLNHRTIELTALVLSVLAFPDLDEDGALMRFALAELEHSAGTDLHPDGVHVEASTHYHALFVRNFMAVRVNLRRYEVAVSPTLDRLLGRAVAFLLHVTRPDGDIVAFSDADTASYLDVLALAAEALEDPTHVWVASRGRRGSPPPCAASFPDGGYFVQRSHWTDEPEPARVARHLVWDCGPLGQGVHGHYDMLHFEASAGGRALVVDPGRYTYAEGQPNWRHLFKGTAAHNTVTVDELDQCDYYPWNIGEPAPRVAEARLLGRWLEPDLDVLVGEVHSPRYDAVHRRIVAMVRGRFWLIVDRLDAPSEHRYDLRFQLTPAAWQSVSVSLTIGARVVDSPGLELVLLGDEPVDIEQGFVAPRYGIKHPAPRVHKRVDGRCVTLVSLLVPHAEDGGRAGLRAWSLDGSAGSLVLIVDRVEHEVRWQADAHQNPVSLMYTAPRP